MNVALPTIQRGLGGGLAAQQWIVNGYLLTLGSLILIGGSLGDLYGERRVFAIGVGGFGAASVLCAVAPSIGCPGGGARAAGGRRRAARAELAGGDREHVPARASAGAAIGSWTAWGAIATVLGPLAGGELLAIASWRWIFVINVPLVIACVCADPRGDPAERAATRPVRRGAIDVPGAAAVRARPRRPGVRADRAAAARAGRARP